MYYCNSFLMQKKILLFIIIIAAFLRLYRLSEVPPGVNRDEASIGYTAYSLMTTGKDEYGRSWPLSFESFGDWKLPLYIYTTIPFVKIFGLSELAVRLPSALAGIASVALLYYLTKILFASEAIALLSSLSLALMPWHIHISRVESEAIVATLFVIIGSILFFRKKLIFSAVFFAATYWTYHGTHVSTTLLLMGMTLIYWKEIIRIPLWWIAAGIGTLLVFGILSVTLAADRTKLAGISIFGDPTVVHTKIELPRIATGHPDAIVTRLRFNRVTFAITTIMSNYIASYSPQFLFIKGGGNRAHNIKGYGNLHPIEAPLLLLGIIWLFKNRKHKSARFFLWWIAIAAIAPAITKDAPHSNRMLMAVPMLAIAIGIGMSTLLRYKLAVYILIFGYITSMMFYTKRYFIDFPKNELAHWGLPYKTLTEKILSPENAHKEIIISKPETSPYIYILFYSAYPPAQYQNEARRYPITSDGFTHVSGFGRYSFRDIYWENDRLRPNTLLIDL